MGKEIGKERIDLELDLEIIKKLLDTDEDRLKRNKGTYGRLAHNGKLNFVRTLGDPEAVAWNYFRKYAGQGVDEIKKLREVELISVVAKLIQGESAGFPCVELTNGKNFVVEAFKECEQNVWGGHDKIKVKSVLKSVLPNQVGAKVPTRGKGGQGHLQSDARQYWSQIYNDDFEKSKVINEKCEQDNWFSGVSDLGLKINSCFKVLGF